MAEEVKTEIVSEGMILDILKKIEKSEKIKIVQFSTGSSSERGENWSSTMIRVDFKATVNGIEKEYHWIGKFPPPTPDRKVFHSGTRMDEKETRAYAEFIPDLKKFIQDLGLESEIHLNFPPCPYAELEKDEFYFFMENMKECGYKEEVNKKLGLDVAHVKITLDELAKFHSTTHAYIMDKAKKSSLDQTLKDMELHTRDWVMANPSENVKKLLDMFNASGRRSLLKSVEGLAEPGEDLVGPVQRYLEIGDLDGHSHFNVKERKVDPNGFNVIIHNDSWFNNMLFKYEFEDGVPVPKKVSLVDIALYCWNSPVVDLSYFFFLSITPETREKHEEELLEFYHSRLVFYLEKFGIDQSIYTLSQLKEEYNRKLSVGLIASLAVLLPVLLPTEQALDQSDFDWSDPEKMMREAEVLFANALKANPAIRKRMRGNIIEALKKGAIS